MVLTDRQRSDLHCGIYEYLVSQEGEAFAKAAKALAIADPRCVNSAPSSASVSGGGVVSDDASVMSTRSSSSRAFVPILEKKWTAVPRLQKKVLELERSLASNAKIYAHRAGSSAGVISGGGGVERRMLPRPPCSYTLKGHAGVVECVAIHPVFTVAVSGSEDGTIKVWDHESGEYVRTLKGHTNKVHSLAFTPTGSHLASCSSDLSIKLWDFSTYTCVRTLRGHDHTISAVRFIPSPASTMSLTSSSEPSSFNNAGETTSSSATGIDVSAAGSSFLLSASRDRTVKFWDLETGFCDHTVSDHFDWVRCIATRESDGELFATSGNDTIIFVYNSTGQRKKVAELRGHEHVVESIAFVTESSAGSRKKTASETKHHLAIQDQIVSGGRDRTVRLWNISTAQCLNIFKYHENWVRSVLFHPSGNYVISAGDDRSLRVMDVKSNRCLRSIPDAHPHFVTSLAMHHTLPILVSGGVDQTVKCWKLD